MAFSGNAVEKTGFSGSIGSECLVDVDTNREYACGPGSLPYCPPVPSGQHKYYGWKGSKLFVILASMPHAGSALYENVPSCSTGTNGNWYDAPWIGLSHGELVRSGKFGDCQCYAKDPAKWYLGDGCGQFNVFEVVNDNNQYKISTSSVQTSSVTAVMSAMALVDRVASWTSSRRRQTSSTRTPKVGRRLANSATGQRSTCRVS